MHTFFIFNQHENIKIQFSFEKFYPSWISKLLMYFLRIPSILVYIYSSNTFGCNFITHNICFFENHNLYKVWCKQISFNYFITPFELVQHFWSIVIYWFILHILFNNTVVHYFTNIIFSRVFRFWFCHKKGFTAACWLQTCWLHHNCAHNSIACVKQLKNSTLFL